MRTRNASKVRLLVERLEGRIPPSIAITSATVDPATGAAIVQGHTSDPNTYMNIYLWQGATYATNVTPVPVNSQGNFATTLNSYYARFVPGGATTTAFDFTLSGGLRDYLPYGPVMLS